MEGTDVIEGLEVLLGDSPVLGPQKDVQGRPFEKVGLPSEEVVRIGVAFDHR